MAEQLVDGELMGTDAVIGLVQPDMPIGYLVAENRTRLVLSDVTPLVSPSDFLTGS